MNFPTGRTTYHFITAKGDDLVLLGTFQGVENNLVKVRTDMGIRKTGLQYLVSAGTIKTDYGKYEVGFRVEGYNFTSLVKGNREGIKGLLKKWCPKVTNVTLTPILPISRVLRESQEVRKC